MSSRYSLGFDRPKDRHAILLAGLDGDDRETFSTWSFQPNTGDAGCRENIRVVATF